MKEAAGSAKLNYLRVVKVNEVTAFLQMLMQYTILYYISMEAQA